MKVLLVTILLLGSLAAATATVTPLTEYVEAFDKNFRWNVSDNVVKGRGFTSYSIYLTSQEWLTQSETNKPIWTHWLQLCIPDDILPDSTHAFLYIDGGSNKNFDQPPSDLAKVISLVCKGSGTIGAGLYQIPNEPIVFWGDPTGKSRSEDAIIAYTWSHFINNTMEPDWLARMPMTKAAIRAMDAMQQFVEQQEDLPNIEKFVVAGASKRGWTTWMVGAMGDPRVAAIAPIVAPIANIVPQINEMWQSYGEWSFALQDYVDMNLMGFLNLPVFTKMLDIIDPLSYMEEMAAIPKYVICSAGDEFFMPDSAKYYWDQLPGEKHYRLVPNAEHSLAGHVVNVLRSVLEYYGSIMDEDQVRPEYSWDISEDGNTITVNIENGVKPSLVRVWHSNATDRDWRVITCTNKSLECVNINLFRSFDLDPISDGVYEATFADPSSGYTAFFIELEFDLNQNDDNVLIVSTDLSIIPTAMPYQPCGVDVCYCGYHCPPGAPSVPSPPSA